MKSSGILVGLLVFLVVLLVISSAVSAETKSLTFQDGDGGAYSSTKGADVAAVFGTTSSGSAASIRVSVGIVIADFNPGFVGFVEFENFIGDNPGQVPPGSAIQSASFQLTRATSSTYGALVEPILDAWDESTMTGSSYPSAGSSIAIIPAGSTGDVQIVSVTGTVQAWVSGTSNYGFRLRAGNVYTVFSESFYSDDAPNVADRPLLSVTFTPPLAPVEPSTWGKVKALYR